MHIPRISTHAARLERWLGAEQVEHVANMGRGWYGPPIPLHGVPGNVWLRGSPDGGDFVGAIQGGFIGNAAEFFWSRQRAALRRWNAKQARTASTGFAGLGDLISEAAAGKKQLRMYQKVSTTPGAAGACTTLWNVGNQPTAGAIGAAAPGGTAYTNASAGALPFADPTVGGDTQHLVLWNSYSNIAAQSCVLYDRLFAVARNMNSATAEAVTGVPTRYQNATLGTADSAAGNFLFMEGITLLAATAHTWDDVRYTDQENHAAVTLPTVTGNSGNAASRLDMPVGQWFAPLAADDHGVHHITQVKTNTAVATGTADVVMGHVLAIAAHPLANYPVTLDGVTGAFNLNRLFDGACLAMMLVTSANSATTFTGTIETVSG